MRWQPERQANSITAPASQVRRAISAAVAYSIPQSLAATNAWETTSPCGSGTTVRTDAPALIRVIILFSEQSAAASSERSLGLMDSCDPATAIRSSWVPRASTFVSVTPALIGAGVCAFSAISDNASSRRWFSPWPIDACPHPSPIAFPKSNRPFDKAYLAAPSRSPLAIIFPILARSDRSFIRLINDARPSPSWVAPPSPWYCLAPPEVVHVAMVPPMAMQFVVEPFEF